MQGTHSFATSSDTDTQPTPPEESRSLWDELEEAWSFLETGYHVCPGAPHIALAAVERLEELLDRVRAKFDQQRRGEK